MKEVLSISDRKISKAEQIGTKWPDNLEIAL